MVVLYLLQFVLIVVMEKQKLRFQVAIGCWVCLQVNIIAESRLTALIQTRVGCEKAIAYSKFVPMLVVLVLREVRKPGLV